MKRRWKVGVALAVVGLAGFLVWAFLSDPMRGLEIRFLGYETNQSKRDYSGITSKTNWLAAHFCLTNGSKQAILCDTHRRTLMFSTFYMTNGGSSLPQSRLYAGPFDLGYIVLESAQASCFDVPIPDLIHPVRVTVPYTTNLPAPGFQGWINLTLQAAPGVSGSGTNSFFTTLQSLVAKVTGWRRRTPSVSITIQDR